MTFISKLSRIINTNQARSVILTGNVYDLFFDGSGYVPLIDFLSSSYKVEPSDKRNGITQIIYEVNNPVKTIGDRTELEAAWKKYGPRTEKKFEEICMNAVGNPTGALEFLRQLTYCSRQAFKKGESTNDLLVIIEAADMLLPEDQFSRMSLADRRRVGIIHDWFSEPDFIHGGDSVILISESQSAIHSHVSRLPQVLAVDVPSPNFEQRKHFVNWGPEAKLPPDFIKNTASLSIHALRQLLCRGEITQSDVISKVEEYITSQLGDAVEFKKPTHNLDDVVGFRRLKNFLRKEMMPRITRDDDGSLPGAAIGGPIGGGKTFIFEAVASELGVPVLVLKNLRSMWFGQTDVILERLQRAISALDKVVIFVDEADTQFGGVSEGTHDTERRLTGKIQAMMSDPQLRGRVVWLLMTARINNLSPDIRRPGRVGDLIIPVLDPEGDDVHEFITWVFGDMLNSIDAPLDENRDDIDNQVFEMLMEITEGYSAAAFASLRSQIKSANCTTIDEVMEVVNDLIPPDIGETREYQTLQAKINCTRQSLLFDEPKSRDDIFRLRSEWRRRIAELERKNVG